MTAPARVGGLERVIRSLAIGQSANGHRVLVLIVVEPGGPDNPLATSLRDAGVEVEVLEIPARAYAAEWRHMHALCRRFRPHVVHTHGFRSDVLDGAAARRFGVPVVATVHGFVRGSWKGRLYEWMQRRAYRRFSAVAAVSKPQVAELLAAGVARDRVHLLPNAWSALSAPVPRREARRLLGLPEEGYVVGWVGRLSREKGADVLLSALAALPDVPVIVSIIGDGKEKVTLQAQAEALGIASRVHWHGLVPEAGPLFPAFDAFALSSRTEGTPIALFEAMEAGVPIVATNVGGVPDVVSGREALLVPVSDPQRLASAIRSVHCDPDAARARAVAAEVRLHVDFGAAPWLAKYEAIYRSAQRSTFRTA